MFPRLVRYSIQFSILFLFASIVGCGGSLKGSNTQRSQVNVQVNDNESGESRSDILVTIRTFAGEFTAVTNENGAVFRLDLTGNENGVEFTLSDSAGNEDTIRLPLPENNPVVNVSFSVDERLKIIDADISLEEEGAESSTTNSSPNENSDSSVTATAETSASDDDDATESGSAGGSNKKPGNSDRPAAGSDTESATGSTSSDNGAMEDQNADSGSDNELTQEEGASEGDSSQGASRSFEFSIQTDLGANLEFVGTFVAEGPEGSQDLSYSSGSIEIPEGTEEIQITIREIEGLPLGEPFSTLLDVAGAEDITVDANAMLDESGRPVIFRANARLDGNQTYSYQREPDRPNQDEGDDGGEEGDDDNSGRP